MQRVDSPVTICVLGSIKQGRLLDAAAGRAAVTASVVIAWQGSNARCCGHLLQVETSMANSTT